MVNNYLDLRVIKTKEAIQDAFFDLSEEKSFEEITVKEITTKAKVNRGTFYAHYEDKYDLLNSYREEFLIAVTEFFSQNWHSIRAGSLKLQITNNPSPPFIVGIIKFLDENRRFLRTTFATQDNIKFMIRIRDLVQKELFEGNNPVIKSDDLPIPKSYYTTYVVSAFMGVIAQWLCRGSKESALEIAEMLSILNIKGPFYAVESNNK